MGKYVFIDHENYIGSYKLSCIKHMHLQHENVISVKQIYYEMNKDQAQRGHIVFECNEQIFFLHELQTTRDFLLVVLGHR